MFKSIQSFQRGTDTHGLFSGAKEQPEPREVQVSEFKRVQMCAQSVQHDGE